MADLVAMDLVGTGDLTADIENVPFDLAAAIDGDGDLTGFLLVGEGGNRGHLGIARPAPDED